MNTKHIFLFVLAITSPVQAQFVFTPNPGGGSVTVTAYSGGGGSVTIPSTSSGGLPVTGIGEQVFESTQGLTSVSIPETVTAIGDGAFEACYQLANVNLPSGLTSIGLQAFANTALTGVSIPGGVSAIGDGAFGACAKLTSVAIGNGVAIIGNNVFENTAITTITIPRSVASIGGNAFYDCRSLASIYFTGNAPSLGNDVFDNDPATALYIVGTLGWSAFSAASKVEAEVWDPLGATGDFNLNIQDGQADLSFTGPENLVVVLKACSDLTKQDWVPVETNAIVNGTFSFSEPALTNSSGRFYIVTAP